MALELETFAEPSAFAFRSAVAVPSPRTEAREMETRAR